MAATSWFGRDDGVEKAAFEHEKTKDVFDAKGEVTEPSTLPAIDEVPPDAGTPGIREDGRELASSVAPVQPVSAIGKDLTKRRESQQTAESSKGGTGPAKWPYPTRPISMGHATPQEIHSFSGERAGHVTWRRSMGEFALVDFAWNKRFWASCSVFVVAMTIVWFRVVRR